MTYMNNPQPALGIRTVVVFVPQNADFTNLGGFATEHIWNVPLAEGSVCVLAKYVPCGDILPRVCALTHIMNVLAKEMAG